MLLVCASPYSPYVPPVQRRFDFGAHTPRTPPSLIKPTTAALWSVREDTVLGSPVRIELWCDTPRASAAAVAAAMDEVQRAQRLLAPQSAASELSRINREAAHHAVPLSLEMTELLARALELARWSAGGLDIARQSGPQNNPQKHGWQQLVLCEQRRTLRFLRGGLSLALQGLAQGHAADRAVQLLASKGVQHAVVAVGGSRRVLGQGRGRPWQVVVGAPGSGSESVSTTVPCQPLTVQLPAGAAHSTLAGALCATAVAADALTSSAVCHTLQALGAARGLALAGSLAGVQAWAHGPAGL
jgi:FAD:protein FMN transferase